MADISSRRRRALLSSTSVGLFVSTASDGVCIWSLSSFLLVSKLVRMSCRRDDIDFDIIIGFAHMGVDGEMCRRRRRRLRPGIMPR